MSRSAGAVSSDKTKISFTPAQTAYRWTRSLHLYLGLFVSPFVLVYALSAIVLNHAVLPWGGRDVGAVERRVVSVDPQSEPDGVALAKQLRSRLGLEGEIGFVRRDEEANQVSFPLEMPGRVSEVSLDVASGQVVIEQRETGAWDALVYMHKKPGPHNVKLRGNWDPMGWWAWLADASVYLILFSTVSGLYLWLVLRAERKTGLVCLGAGALSLAGCVLALAV